jgi:hypothetical protein
MALKKNVDRIYNRGIGYSRSHGNLNKCHAIGNSAILYASDKVMIIQNPQR